MTGTSTMRILTIAMAVVLAAACSRGQDLETRAEEVPAAAIQTPATPVEAPVQPTVEAGMQTLSADREPACRTVDGLVLARRFTLDEPHGYRWKKDHPDVTSGTIVVLEVEPECARPRQTAMPILYAGETPVEIAFDGYPSGRLVAIVPGDVDPSTTPFFYGAPGLPERVDGERGAAELAAALEDGIAPFPATVVEEALERGGKTLALGGTTELYEEASRIAFPGGTEPAP